MRTLIAIVILLALAAGVSAESIEECILKSPNDAHVIAWQSNAVSHNTIQANLSALQIDYPVERDYVPVLLYGDRVGRTFYFTDTWRRMGWTYQYAGNDYLFIFNDDRLPGVRDFETKAWHGICLLVLP